MAQITAEVKDVSVLGIPSGVGHLFVVFKNDSGQEFIVSGGPEGNFPSFGNITVESGVPIDDERDENGNPSTAVKGIKLLDFGDRSPEDVWALMVQHGQQIDAAGLSYLLFDQNSNSTIASLLHLVGLEVGASLPESELPTPGSENLLQFDYKLTGTDSGDIIHGVGGNDTFAGALGDDRLFGSLGDDLFFGGSGSDALYGGSGPDRLEGGSGDDFAFGGSAADLLVGAQGTDEHYGGLGDDTLEGGRGRDLLFGGADSDRVYGGSGNDRLEAGSGDDLVYGGLGDETAWADSGHDRVFGDEGDDTLRGQDGDDSLVGGSGRDSLLPGSGDDHVEGGSGNDRLGGGTGIDRLYGGDQPDFLNGGGGSDTAAGGDGNDTYVVDTATDLVVEKAGEGIRDMVRSNASAFALPTNLPDNEVERGGINPAAGAGTLFGNEYDNVLLGNLYDNFIAGGSGDDSLHGLGGDDRLVGGSGRDRLLGRSGNDFMVLDERDIGFGGTGADSFFVVDTDTAGPLIQDFSGSQFGAGTGEGDLIALDLAELNGVFAYRGEGAFLADGNSQARFAGNEKVMVDSDGDGGADLYMRIDNLSLAGQLTATDFIWV